MCLLAQLLPNLTGSCLPGSACRPCQKLPHWLRFTFASWTRGFSSGALGTREGEATRVWTRCPLRRNLGRSEPFLRGEKSEDFCVNMSYLTDPPAISWLACLYTSPVSKLGKATGLGRGNSEEVTKEGREFEWGEY